MLAKQRESIAKEWHGVSEQLCWRLFPLGDGVVDVKALRVNSKHQPWIPLDNEVLISVTR